MVLVLGSINIDLTTVANEIPQVGETVIGKSFNQYPGGKGANQAVCAARLGTKVSFLGKVGNDSYGDFMLEEMKNSGVDVSHIEKSEASTGMAAISVDEKGQNSIIVVPGANFSVDCTYIDRHIGAIADCDIILAQHETPIETTEYAFEIAKKYNKTTILNPAPADKISEKLISLTDILVPNEHELLRITGMPCKTTEDISIAARTLQNQGAKTVLVTLGKDGVMLFNEHNEQVFPAFQVDAVDTVAAGDSFLGGFATSFSKVHDMAQAINYGQTVASYTVQHKGAQCSMPTLEQFKAYQKTICFK